jgi:hypothetical protein
MWSKFRGLTVYVLRVCCLHKPASLCMCVGASRKAFSVTSDEGKFTVPILKVMFLLRIFQSKEYHSFFIVIWFWILMLGPESRYPFWRVFIFFLVLNSNTEVIWEGRRRPLPSSPFHFVIRYCYNICAVQAEILKWSLNKDSEQIWVFRRREKSLANAWIRNIINMCSPNLETSDLILRKSNWT